jgi:hypothetical protein
MKTLKHEKKNKKKDKIITYDYGKYIGETNEKDLPHGEGLLVRLNGEQYEGEFKNGKYDGHGKINDLSGREYIGNFSDGKFNGKGKLVWKNEDSLNCYEGEFKNDRVHGNGKKTQTSIKVPTNEIERIGYFVDGAIKKGRWIVKSKGRVEGMYEGEFKNDNFHGNGIFTSYLDDNANYVKEGAWKNKCKWKNGKPTSSIFKSISQKLFGK